MQQSGGGLVSAACDEDALTQNLLALYAMSAPQRGEMGQNAKEYYEKHYRRAELLRRLETFILQGN